MNKAIEIFLNELQSVELHDSKSLADGTRLLGEKPNREAGDLQYIHAIFAPLSNQELLAVEEIIGLQLPLELQEFYVAMNGFLAFSGSLSFSGLKRSSGRTSDDSAWQPISAEYGNRIDRLPDTPKSCIAVGFYPADDGAIVHLDSVTGMVVASNQASFQAQIFRWRSLSEFLIAEGRRMAQLYRSRQGRVSALNPLPLQPVQGGS